MSFTPCCRQDYTINGLPAAEHEFYQLAEFDFDQQRALSFSEFDQLSSLFNLLQATVLLKSGTLAESLTQLAEFDVPPDVFATLRASSTDGFLTNVSLELSHFGTDDTLDLWGIKLVCQNDQDIVLSSSQLGNPTTTAVIMDEHWASIPHGRCNVSVVPEPGSVAARYGDALASTVIVKARDLVIDFTQTDDFSGEVVFAEIFGNSSGMHYHFTSNTRIQAQLGYEIVVKNVERGNIFATGQERIDNLNVFLLTSWELLDQGAGRGWHDLLYLFGGLLVDSDNDMQFDDVIDAEDWSHWTNQFSVYQQPL